MIIGNTQGIVLHCISCLLKRLLNTNLSDGEGPCSHHSRPEVLQACIKRCRRGSWYLFMNFAFNLVLHWNDSLRNYSLLRNS